ncbi:helix-turn-helix domain-containing protein [Micromonospora sp. 4G55]|uniref:winged helix-turn-helix transcriptional regulator n=1 Tax=Micromonospora sp. 4G55 TaxID=2806102 RepID=UPI001EE4D910|nr:helix-turn-helix domain-containing protein [Micromonospora sp. 4G55]
MRRADLADADCGIAQALGVLGDWWTFLIVRDVAGGTTRFDALQRELGVSRRALTERLAALVEHGVLRREAYSHHPPRYDYLLTPKGEGLLPVLVALQDWGSRHVMGDGALTATALADSAEARRVRQLVGRRLRRSRCPGTTAATSRGRAGPLDGALSLPRRVRPRRPGTSAGWGNIPGA